MKLERHIAVAIGDGLEASSTALHGRGNARLVVVLRTSGHDACHLGRRPPVHAGRRLGLRLCVLGYANDVRGGVSCQNQALAGPCPALSRRTLGTVAVEQPRHPWPSALLLCSVECYARGP